MMRDVVGYTGELTFDQSKPDGMLAKFRIPAVWRGWVGNREPPFAQH